MIKTRNINEKLNADIFNLPQFNNNDIVYLDLSALQHFKDHKFAIYEGAQLNAMVESISNSGIIHPIIVRKIMDNKYEILSGHNRCNAALLAGLKDVPCIVKEMLSDEEALEIVLISNFYQRSVNDLLPSQRAAVIAQYYAFTKKNSIRNNYQFGYMGVVNKTTDKFELSKSAIYEYIKIDSLCDSLKMLLDSGIITIKIGNILGNFSHENQMLIAPYLSTCKVNIKQITDLVLISKHFPLEKNTLDKFFTKEVPQLEMKISLNYSDIEHFFPETLPPDMINKKIIEALAFFSKSNGKIC